jgi:DNA (cytosine-5)-methyltransferase 1
MRKNALSAVSLFSGAGGMDVGFSQAGFDIVFANDLDPVACATFEDNDLGVAHVGSIREARIWRKLEAADIVFGGPPCQGFSVAGKMDPADARSDLMNTYFDVIDKVNPVAFACENVKALAVLSRWSSVRERLIERASKKYIVALLVLKASDFGVPQIRERMFLLGIRKDRYKGTDDSLKNELLLRLSTLEEVPPTVADVVRKLGRAGSAANARICRAKITFARSPVLRRSAYAGMLFNGAGRPLPAKGCATTLPASMGGNKTPIIDEAEIFEGAKSYVEEYHQHLIKGGQPRSGNAPPRLRRLTIDECLAIQTFPIGFKLSGSQSAQYRQIGNAVPCQLAKAVATALRDTLLGEALPQQLEAAE